MTILFTLLFLFVLGCFVFAVITYLLYWYEHQSRIESLFDSREAAVRATRSGILSAFKALIFVIGMYPAGIFIQCWKKRRPQSTAVGCPIIMVHGLFHNCSAWFLFRYWFRKHGLKTCSTFNYSSCKPFNVVSDELNNYLETILKQEPTIKPVLISHSLGGLFLRNWLASSEHADKIAGVITLGAPMQGSKLAIFSVTSLGQELGYRGELIKQIEKREQVHPEASIPCYMFYSPVDNMVLPQESISTPPKNWVAIKTRPVSHIAMLFDKTIANQVAETAKTLLSK